MSLFTFTSTLLTAAVAITSVQASPFSGLDTRSLSGLLARDLSGKLCKPFVYGAKRDPVGDVCVSFSGDSLTVTYPDLSSVGGSYGDLHVIVQPTKPSVTAPGQWPYKLDNGYCTKSGTCTIPILDTWRACGLDLYIGIHAAFIPKTGSASETGYADGDCIDPKNSGNCAKYFVFKTECQCVQVTKYEEVKTSAVYVKTIYETSTVYCSTTPPDATATATCNDAKVGATKVTTATKEIKDFACSTPAW